MEPYLIQYELDSHEGELVVSAWDMGDAAERAYVFLGVAAHFEVLPYQEELAGENCQLVCCGAA